MSLQPEHNGRPQPWQSVQQGQPAMMRASHADRERAMDVLKAGFAEGRLSQEQYRHRMERAHQAQTYGELYPLVADLPQGPVPMMPSPPVPHAFAPPALRPPTNGAATGALICGLLTPLTSGLSAVPAVILGHKARAEIRRTGESGDGLATAGLVLGYMVLGVVGLVCLVALIGLGLMAVG